MFSSATICSICPWYVFGTRRARVLRAEYDGGGFSPRTEVTIYDEDGNELDKGLVDEEGKFHFEKA